MSADRGKVGGSSGAARGAPRATMEALTEAPAWYALKRDTTRSQTHKESVT